MWWSVCIFKKLGARVILCCFGDCCRAKASKNLQRPPTQVSLHLPSKIKFPCLERWWEYEIPLQILFLFDMTSNIPAKPEGSHHWMIFHSNDFWALFHQIVCKWPYGLHLKGLSSQCPSWSIPCSFLDGHLLLSLFLCFLVPLCWLQVTHTSPYLLTS